MERWKSNVENGNMELSMHKYSEKSMFNTTKWVAIFFPLEIFRETFWFQSIWKRKKKTWNGVVKVFKFVQLTERKLSLSRSTKYYVIQHTDDAVCKINKQVNTDAQSLRVDFNWYSNEQRERVRPWARVQSKQQLLSSKNKEDVQKFNFMVWKKWFCEITPHLASLA